MIDICLHLEPNVFKSGNSNRVLLSFDNDKFQYRSIHFSSYDCKISPSVVYENNKGEYYDKFEDVLINLPFLK